MLEVTFPEAADLFEWEIVEEGKTYREWCMPAAVINRDAIVRLVSEDEAFSGRRGGTQRSSKRRRRRRVGDRRAERRT